MPSEFRALLPEGYLRVHPLGPTGGQLALHGVRRAVISCEGWREPRLALDEAATASLRDFVEHGGRLVLLGFAARLACELGIEEEWPESESFRWGFDARTVRGEARLGIEVTTGRHPALFDGLAPAGDAEFTHHVAGGAPCCVPVCAWTIGAPRNGEVLARLACELDGIPGPPGPAVLLRWRVGAGEVLALGLEPQLEHADEAVRGNARRLLRNLLGVGPEGHGAAVMLRVPAPERAPLPRIAVDFARRDLPMRPLLAHWGWSAAVAQASDREQLRDADEIVRDVLAPSWQAGADLLELEACHPDRGLSLVWREADALRRPPGFRGAAFGGAFGAAAFGLIADEAHGRGMVVHAFVDPPPVGDSARERLATLRFVARQLACVRTLGPRAIDGFGVRQWLPDGAGYSRTMVQDFNPSAYLFGLGEGAPAIAGALRALDAEDGALRGLATAGVVDGWRDAPRDRYPLGVLDARAWRPQPSKAGPGGGGGSFGDWIVRQANDFVRARQGDGAALWWRTHDVEALGRLGLDYVQGISLDPLRAAVAMQLAATGENGYRTAAVQLVRDAPAEFARAVAAPAAVHVLQNNWFRLVGSGGSLLFDPAGEARFGAGEALLLSPSFLHTRLFGGRPDVTEVKTADIDLLRRGAGHEGGYERTTVVGTAPGLDPVVPAMLAFDDQPRWPQRAQIELTLDAGYYELEIGPRAVRERGILILGLDGVVLDCRPFVVGSRTEVATVPVHVARGGVRVLELTVAEGGTVAIDHLRLVRRGDVAAEGRIELAAGHLAVLGERSSSSLHDDDVELRTIGDFPGFLLRVRCQRVAGGLRIERSFRLPAYRQLAGAAGEERRLRAPFLLRADAPELPDLLVVPIQLARYDHLRFADGQLVLHGNPESGAECRIGFWLAPHGCGEDLLASGGAMFRGLDQPFVLDLGETGRGTLVSDLAIPWTRVVRVQGDARTPFLVRENGWWTWRGGQPAEEGGAWLRVCQLPADVVQVVGGSAVLAGTRPGPGSLHVVALRDPEPRQVHVRVLQPSRLLPPSVVMAADFEEVLVDGEPWAWFDGRTVFLPDEPGDYQVATRTHAGTGTPHVASTRAPLVRCAYDRNARALLLQSRSDPTLPAGLPYAAVLRGPRPVRIENGEIVAEDRLPHADAVARARAAAGGVLIRFRPGLTKVFYED